MHLPSCKPSTSETFFPPLKTLEVKLSSILQEFPWKGEIFLCLTMDKNPFGRWSKLQEKLHKAQQDEQKRLLEALKWNNRSQERSLTTVKALNILITAWFSVDLSLISLSLVFTTAKWVQIIIQILFQNHLHCCELSLQSMRQWFIQAEFCSSHKPLGQWECNFEKIFSIKLYFTQKLTCAKNQEKIFHAL